MFKVTVLLTVLVATCLADDFKCGEMPSQIYTCLNSPTVIPKDIIRDCNEFTDRCERNTCIFRKSGWLDGDVVKKDKVGEFYDGLAVTYPAIFGPAVAKIKEKCLTTNLKGWSSYANCQTYDIMLCSISTVFRNALPTAWKTSDECEVAKKYAAQCPVCPADCFGKTVAEDVCQICKTK